MKKLVLLLALVLIAGLCFAQYDDEEEVAQPKRDKVNLEVSIGVPVHWTTSPAPHKFFDDDPDMDRTVTTSTSIGFALNLNFGQKVGLALDFDVFVGSDVMGHTGTDSYSSSLFGMNLLLGPVIYLYNGSFLRVPLAIGPHMYYWSSSNWTQYGTPGAMGDWMKTKDLQFGLGLYLGIQFHFNNNLYMFSRTNVAIDFLRFHSVIAEEGDLDKSHFKPEFGWMVKPALGVGVKF